MKRHLSLFLILIMLFVCVAGASASFGFRPYVSGSYGVNLCHPTADYLGKYPGDESVETPFFRTSTAFSLDAQLLEGVFSVGSRGSFSFGFGASYINVSQSKPWGRSVLKPYTGLGASFDIAYHFSSRFELAVKYRWLFCAFTGSSQRFIAHDIELAPAYTVVAPWAFDLAVTLPVTVSIKADAVSFRAGIGVMLAFDSRRTGGKQ